MDKKLLDILACPVCKGPLVYREEEGELICKADQGDFYQNENDDLQGRPAGLPDS